MFDFAELDECSREARESGLRLVLLWFGSFKNGAIFPLKCAESALRIT
jgi:hypothetical protein